MSKVVELPGEESTPEGNTQENTEATTDDVSLMIMKALVTSLQQQKGTPDLAAEKRKKAKCYKYSGVSHYTAECLSEEGALNGKPGSLSSGACLDKPFWQKQQKSTPPSAEKQKPVVTQQGEQESK